MTAVRAATRRDRRGPDDTLTARDIRAVNLGNHPTTEVLTTLAELAATETLRVRINTQVSLDQAPTAITQARAGHARGKTIIIP